jgi:hypothetical protein
MEHLTLPRREYLRQGTHKRAIIDPLILVTIKQEATFSTDPDGKERLHVPETAFNGNGTYKFTISEVMTKRHEKNNGEYIEKFDFTIECDHFVIETSSIITDLTPTLLEARQFERIYTPYRIDYKELLKQLRNSFGIHDCQTCNAIQQYNTQLKKWYCPICEW